MPVAGSACLASLFVLTSARTMASSASSTGAPPDEPPAPEGEADAAAARSSDSNEGVTEEATEDAEASVGSPQGHAEPDDVPTLRAWFEGAPLPRITHLLLGLVAPAIALLVNMWRVRRFTIDDAYISYRYARNFANGLGLVYNPGERIEGFTNFAWTLILAAGIAVGIDPDVLVKVLGGGFALGLLGVTYVIAQRFAPFGALPCVATWLLATSIVTSGYAVFGLETSMFVFLVMLGLELMWREEERAPKPKGWSAWGLVSWRDRASWLPLPWSGVIFGIAFLTRPEAPMFLGVAMLWLGLGSLNARNIVRGLVFSAFIGGLTAFRYLYFGGLFPATASAKTGDWRGQLYSGWGYLEQYAAHAGPLLWLALLGAAIAFVRRGQYGSTGRVRTDILTVASLALCVGGYICVVGGDWMPMFRFMAPFEPMCFLLVDLGARWIVAQRQRIATAALLLFGAAMVVHRVDAIIDAQKSILAKEDRFWRMAAGGTARWLNENAVPGEIAIGDIGYVGWATDFPVLDLLGLVDPVISQLPGAYTRKLGPGFTQRFFDKQPRYALIISSSMDCQKPSVPGSQVLYNDRRFKNEYEVSGKVPLDGGYAWCIFERKADRARDGGVRPPGTRAPIAE